MSLGSLSLATGVLVRKKPILSFYLEVSVDCYGECGGRGMNSDCECGGIDFR